MAAIEYEFVDIADDSLICPICQDVARDPHQEENCGKLFCIKCIKKIKDHRCPTCRTNKPKYFEDKRSKREIRDLRVKCKNNRKGCEWIGSLSAVNNHVTKSCDFTLVTCKHEDIGCTERRPRKRMREHEDDTSFHFSLSMDAVKKLTQERNTLSTNGIVIKMTNYKARMENNSSFKSDPFYSHHNGYKLSLRVWLNGEKNYIKIGLQLLTGPYDASLSWPFEGSIKLQVLNQIEDEDHISKHVDVNSDDNWESSVKLISQFSLFELTPLLWSTTQYIKDDTVYFNIKIELEKYKPWLNAST